LRASAVALLLALPGLGCIEDRLTVDVTTEIREDGTCHRRILYTLDRVDTEREDQRGRITETPPPLLKLHRFPRSRAWSVTHDLFDSQEVVSVEGDLDSPNAIGSDYWRVSRPKVAPARNEVTFAIDAAGEDHVYEYRERFVDPVSPVAAARHFAQALTREDEAFTREFTSRVEGRVRSEVKRIYRDSFALPFARAVQALSPERSFGLRERAALDALFQKPRYDAALAAALAAGGGDPDRVRSAVDESLDAILPSLEAEMNAAGVPLDVLAATLSHERPPVRFVAHLVMPGRIVRANTCAEGDEASWEFDSEDLYGRGFEMWARAAGPR
jgi:hypothetical protein